MQPRTGVSLALVLALAACQGTPAAIKHATAAKASTPPPEASAGPPATPQPHTLKRPAGDLHVLAGQVSVDGFYLQQTLGAAVRLDGKTLILSNNGAALVSEAGGSIVSDNAGGVVANNGGAILGKMKRAVLDAEALAIGDQLPVAGILVRVVDPSTGQALALGQDEAGKPVYEVATNATGGFQVYLPPKVDVSTIRVSSAVAGSSDARLAYDVFTGNQAQQVTVDEDTALVGRFLRSAFSSQVEKIAHQLDGTAPSPLPGEFGPGGGPFGSAGQLDFLLGGGTDQIKAALKEAHSTSWTPAQLQAVAAATSEALLARASLDTIKAFSGEKLALDELREVVATGRQKTAEAMRGGQDFHDAPFLVATNQALPPERRYVIKRPSDLLDYLDREILASADRTKQDQLQQVFALIGMPGDSYLNIFDAMIAVNLAIVALMQDPAGVDAVVATIRKGPPS